jgi:hypothetical protein
MTRFPPVLRSQVDSRQRSTAITMLPELGRSNVKTREIRIVITMRPVLQKPGSEQIRKNTGLTRFALTGNVYPGLVVQPREIRRIKDDQKTL